MNSHFPYFCKGLTVRGFGRGGKDLGMPTGMIEHSFHASHFNFKINLSTLQSLVHVPHACSNFHPHSGVLI